MKKITDILLELNNASVQRDSKLILNRINLKIAINEQIAILGPNGSGKSTLIKLITGDIRPLYHANNPIKLLGETHWVLSELRHKIGLVSNELQANYQRKASGLNIILSGFDGSIGVFNHNFSKTQLQKAKEISKVLEISHLLEQTINNMSSGEAKRFLIARALVHNPQMLILDEPTNSLDIKAQSIVKASIQNLIIKKQGLIMVTHQLSDILQEFSRVILIKNGKIVADGPRSIVYTAKNISTLFDMDIDSTLQQSASCNLY
ncbi:MAG: ATP-binding cassette domain-containing protein [Candidatus Margulisbacteria bacterium]|nr:ATP-binding cassette domain-containing protein [Candidatus Margulisiibacteriota bacterium]